MAKKVIFYKHGYFLFFFGYKKWLYSYIITSFLYFIYLKKITLRNYIDSFYFIYFMAIQYYFHGEMKQKSHYNARLVTEFGHI